jgi:hypothetical protein
MLPAGLVRICQGGLPSGCEYSTEIRVAARQGSPGRLDPEATSIADAARTVEACWAASLAGSNDGSIAEVVRGGRHASQTGWAQ